MPHKEEETFRNYTAKQAQDYSDHRGSYADEIIDFIIAHHTQTNGEQTCVLDIGCGPGNSTRVLASRFDRAIGIDPSPEMIKMAQKNGGTAGSSTIEYRVSLAEDCEGIPDHSVDLITAAMSAHWFDLQRFWHTAARILKPKGSVAFFNVYRVFVHPATPNRDQVQAELHKLERETLREYTTEGNVKVMENYTTLEMPWQVSPKCAEFDEASYLRKVWNEGGRPEPDGRFIAGEEVMPFEFQAKAASTSSSITRWREAHPDIAHTDKDCVNATFANVRGLLGPDATSLNLVGQVVLLMVKKF